MRCTLCAPFLLVAVLPLAGCEGPMGPPAAYPPGAPQQPVIVDRPQFYHVTPQGQPTKPSTLVQPATPLVVTPGQPGQLAPTPMLPGPTLPTPPQLPQPTPQPTQPAPPAPQPAPQPAALPAQVYVAFTSVNIFEKPDGTSQKIASSGKGTALKVPG